MKAITVGKTVAIGLCVLATSVRATPITTLDVGLSSSLVVGEIIPPQQSPPGQEARDQAMINTVVTMYNAGTPSAAPYYISGNVFSKPLPSAVTTGDVITAAGGISYTLDGNVTITLGTGFKYLIAVYDGQNSGGVVWNISGLAAGSTVEIPKYAQPTSSGTDLKDGKYGITTWSLFNPGTSRIPDGGMTLALLGTSLCGLGLFARRRK